MCATASRTRKATLPPLGWAWIFDPPKCKAAGGEPSQSVPVRIEQRKKPADHWPPGPHTDILVNVAVLLAEPAPR